MQQWKKTLNIHEHEPFFHQLYQDINGFLISRQARKNQDALDYVYGEIEFTSFIALLSQVQPNEETIFYDLGCGVGKAVIACALVYPVKQSIGVEILPELYETANQQLKKLAAEKRYLEKSKKIKFILSDFLVEKIFNSSIIFINSSAIFDPTWSKLCQKINQISAPCTVITTSKALPCKNFSLIKSLPVLMSWGVVNAYIHIRKKN